MYRVVRVNNDNHPDRSSAMADMRSIIERGFYWKMSGDVEIPYGTPLVAVGCYGGAGLFLIGICNGVWEAEPQAEIDGGRWHRRIPVVWQPVIYTHDDGKAAVKTVSGMLSKFNLRFGAEATQDEFRQVMDFVLSGKVVYPSISKRAA